MRNHRRKFIKNTLAATAAISIVGMVPACVGENAKHSRETNEKVMKKLVLKQIDHTGPLDIDMAEKLLESHADIQVIETVNWVAYPYKPEVKFKIAYCQDHILLKYYVSEENILAKETQVNGRVHKDSCVEFFISTAGNDTYYNFEFNCIGIPHVGYGEARTNRVLIDPEILKLISVKSSLGEEPFEEKTGGHQWEIMIVIPKECLVYDQGIILKGLKASANFYKCGDDTSKPHFVSWNPVGTEEPDYHQPSYFGKILFE